MLFLTACLCGLVGQTTNHGAHWPVVASASRVQFPGKEVYRLCRWACYRIKFLDRYTGTEGSPVSSIICDRWQRLNLELFNRWILMFQDVRAVSRPSRGPWLCAGRPACYRLAPVARWACVGGPAYRAAARLGTEKQS